MSWRPAFQLGMWNAWILMVLLLGGGTIPLYIDSERVDKRTKGDPTGNEVDLTTKRVHVLTHLILMPFTLIYSIFLPLKLGTWWFLVGVPIWLLGVVMLVMFGFAWATAPLDVPLTKGAYAISRHPACFGMFLGYVGIGIACASWVFWLCALAHIVAWHYGVIEEERSLLVKYGDAYREYMGRTPRWIGTPKSG